MKKRILLVVMLLLLAVLFSGCCIKHDWLPANCEKPETCSRCDETQGESLGHDWLEVSCEAPKTCVRCKMTEGEALPHTVVEGGCEADTVCADCDAILLKAPGHSIVEETETTPRMCTNCDYMEPMQYESGTVYIGKGLKRSDGLINFYFYADGGDNYYIKLKDENGKDVYSFLAGSFTPMSVPEGKYYVYFAKGFYTYWYGPEHLFGSITECFTSGDLIDLTGNTRVTYDFRSSFYSGGSGTGFDPISADQEDF